MTTATDQPLPLHGVRVIEFTQTIMGPSAGMILADLGAEVLKIEPAPGGDKTRRLAGFAAGFFGAFNRNKKSVALDLKSEKGREAVHRLAQSADVLIENYAPGTMEKLGCGYDTLRAINPRLIYCALKGFLSGPYEKRPALDEVVQYMAGLAYMTGPPGRPLRAGSSVIDIMGGTYAVLGILCALRDRERTGVGAHVKSALFECTALLVAQHMVAESVTGVSPPPMPARRGAWAVYETFDTRDGEKIFVGLTSDNHWQRFCTRFDRRDLLDDPTLKTNEDRVAARDRTLPIVAEVVSRYTLPEMAQICEEIEIPYSPVAKPTDLFDDPHLNHNNRLLELQLPGGVRTKVPRLPIEVGTHDFGLRSQPPGIGADTRAVLRDVGYSEGEIAEMLAGKVARADG